MRYKGTLIFIIALLIILLIYLEFIININYIIISYHEKSAEYTNIYYKNEEEPYVLYELRELKSSGEYNKISEEDIKKIKTSTIIKNIIEEFADIDETKLENYMKKLSNANYTVLINENIIYINNPNYELAFTLDFKNIIYQEKNEMENAVDWSTRKVEIDNKETIYEKVSKKIKDLGITQQWEFEPETIYFKYAIEGDIDSDVYAVEDNRSGVKVDVMGVGCQIIKIQIGFEKSIMQESLTKNLQYAY